AATGFARSAREELVGTGVTLSTVMPSAVRTQLVDGIPFKWWERLGVIPPGIVARRAVGTLKRRPAVVGAPAGTVALLRLYHV
ncbi:SDR family NAD(P)-dependent oxidoreductase, partial [Mycobacterium kansasii]